MSGEKRAFRPEPAIVTDQFYRRAKLADALNAMTVSGVIGQDQITGAVEKWASPEGTNFNDQSLSGLDNNTIRLLCLLLDELAHTRWERDVLFLHSMRVHIEDCPDPNEYIQDALGYLMEERGRGYHK